MSDRTPTDKEKISVYESLLHQIQLNAEIIMSEARMKKLIGLICDWSYAHRVGNGEYSEENQQKLINMKFWKINEVI